MAEGYGCFNSMPHHTREVLQTDFMLHAGRSTKDVLCRYHMHGACNRGASCPFSHDLSKPQSMVSPHRKASHCCAAHVCFADCLPPCSSNGLQWHPSCLLPASHPHPLHIAPALSQYALSMHPRSASTGLLGTAAMGQTAAMTMCVPLMLPSSSPGDSLPPKPAYDCTAATEACFTLGSTPCQAVQRSLPLG